MNQQRTQALLLFFIVLGISIYPAFTLIKSSRIFEQEAIEQKENVPVVFSQADSCRDAQGNIYAAIQIGSQTWMAENLKNTLVDCPKGLEMQFTNGIERGPTVKFYDEVPRYAYYNNEQKSGLGVIYNYAALQHCDVCPDGYRIPSYADWELLIKTVGEESQAGLKLLEGGSSGFNGELAGRIDAYGSVLKDHHGFWWSSTLDSGWRNPRAYAFEVNAIGVIRIVGQDIRVGNYVRCIKE